MRIVLKEFQERAVEALATQFRLARSEVETVGQPTVALRCPHRRVAARR